MSLPNGAVILSLELGMAKRCVDFLVGRIDEHDKGKCATSVTKGFLNILGEGSSLGLIGKDGLREGLYCFHNRQTDGS